MKGDGNASDGTDRSSEPLAPVELRREAQA
jgi:hypothetical protein